MKFYVTTSNALMYLLPGFAYMFNKYWAIENQEVVVLGYDEPDFSLPDNFSFVSLGKQGQWTTPIKSYFESIDDEYFGITMENIWMASPHDRNMIKFVMDKLEAKELQKVVFDSHETVGPPPCSFTKYNDEFDMLMFDQNSICRYTLITQIVTREYFLKHMEPECSAWDYEKIGMEAAKNDGANVVFTSLKSSPKIADIINKGELRKTGRLGISNIIQEDLKYLREKKFVTF